MYIYNICTYMYMYNMYRLELIIIISEDASYINGAIEET